MPLTDFQKGIASLLKTNRSAASYLAGGAGLHLRDASLRFSGDLDYFNDDETTLKESSRRDIQALKKNGFTISVELETPTYLRVIARSKKGATKIEWAHDSDWRFYPAIEHPEVGFILHPIDLATNKLLALAGRNEVRDYLDVIWCSENILPLGALCWAAVGKDPGFTPGSILALLRRKGRFTQEQLDELNTTDRQDVVELKSKWLAALDDAESFIAVPSVKPGCIFLFDNMAVQPTQFDQTISLRYPSTKGKNE